MDALLKVEHVSATCKLIHIPTMQSVARSSSTITEKRQLRWPRILRSDRDTRIRYVLAPAKRRSRQITRTNSIYLGHQRLNTRQRACPLRYEVKPACLDPQMFVYYTAGCLLCYKVSCISCLFCLSGLSGVHSYIHSSFNSQKCVFLLLSCH